MSDEPKASVPVRPQVQPVAPSPRVAGARKIAPLPQTVEAFRELMVLGADNPAMPEAIFIDFLREVYNPTNDTFNTTLWYQTFGTHRKGIDVTDPSGKTLFVCPPIVGTLQTRTSRKEGTLLSDVANQAALEGKRHAMLEKRRMEEGISQYKPKVAYDIHERWRAILEKYDMLPKTQEATKTFTPESLLNAEADEL